MRTLNAIGIVIAGIQTQHEVMNRIAYQPVTEDSMAKYGKKAAEKVKKAMHERKRGTLKSGRSGKTVKSKKQAIAIGLSEARETGGKVPAKKSARKKPTGRKAASRKSPSRKPTARQSSARQSSSRKATARKSTARKSSSKK